MILYTIICLDVYVLDVLVEEDCTSVDSHCPLDQYMLKVIKKVS